MMKKGTIISMPVPQATEIMADAGFEWVLIDMEHSALGLDDVHNILNAAGDRLLTIVRVPGNDDIWIKRVLDLGCDGILVPMVNSREAAEAAVTHSLYPPAGSRSVGVSRAHGYGPGFREYVSGANSNLIVMLQIEHIEAVRNIDSILSVEGISALFIGPYDLSASMGLTGQVTHPEVVSAIEMVKESCNSAGLPWGIFSMTPEGLDNHIADGCTYSLCGIDAFMLANEAGRISKRMGS
jgi:2-dehydro-3-deoxyglucarate aldolase/4-hydroxy-2-oxoheptanedioate aldolase